MTPKLFQKTDKLYHYTSFETALKIIASGKLKYGRLRDMNDVNEAYRYVYYNKDLNISSQDVLQELSLYRQLSFSVDGVNCGYNISPMWGHYAQKGRGVCLVIDRNKIEKLLSLKTDVYSKTITYKSNYSGDIDIEMSDIPQSIASQKDEIFFSKSSEWEYEQEYRVVKKFNDTDGDKFLDIKDCIIAVMMYYADDVNYSNSVFDSLNYHILRKVGGDEMLILELSKTLAHSATLCDCKSNSYSDLLEESTIDV
jgi:hypothetical protein